MELSEEIKNRIFALYGNNNDVRKLVYEGDINGLCSYLYLESYKLRIPFLNSGDIVQACESLDFQKLEELYFKAFNRLNTINKRLYNMTPLNIESLINSYKKSYPNSSEQAMKDYIESVKQEKFKEKMFLKEVVESFKNLNLQGIYIKSKRAEEVASLHGDIARLLRFSMEEDQEKISLS